MLTFLKSFVQILKDQHRLKDTLFDLLKKDATPLIKSEFSELQEAYEALCTRHNITSPPTVYIHSSPPIGGYAFTKNNAIFLNDYFLKQYTPAEQISLLAHELGHILRGDVGASVRKAEQATDRLAVTMTGDVAPLASVVRHNATQFNQEQELLSKYGWTGKIARWSRDQRQKKSYGTFEERLKNIEKCDIPDTRSQLDKLLEERERASIVHRPFFR